MKKNLLPLILVLALLGCKEEDLVPLDRLSVSVPQISNVDEAGAVFSATVQGLGTEEVLEYGFLWTSANDGPTLGSNASKISRTGNPPKTFNLRVERDLSFRQMYYVVTFLRTAERIYYSESVNFVSKGSKSLVLEEVIANEEVYFGDTVTIRVGNLRNESQLILKLEFENEAVPFFDFSPEAFSFILPRNFILDQVDSENNLYDLKVKLGIEEFNYELPLKFKDPIFQAKKSVGYTNELTISGNYFFTAGLFMTYTHNAIEYRLKAYAANDSVIRFPPDIFFFEKNPVFKVVIRHKTYEISPFEIADTDIKPGQNLVAESETFLYKVNVENMNFIRSPYESPYFFASPEAYSLQYYDNGSDFVRFTVSPTGAVRSREFEVYANNFGEKSSNFAKAIYRFPTLPTLDLPNGLAGKSQMNATSDGGKGYFFSEDRIFEFDPDSYTLDQVGEINSENGGQSIFEAFEGKIYLSSFDATPSQTQLNFYAFDVASNQETRLANLPLNGEVLATFVSSESLFVYLKKILNNQEVYYRLRYAIAQDIWEVLLEETPAFIAPFAPFEYQGKLSALTAMGLNSEGYYSDGLFVWDESSFTWTFQAFIQDSSYDMGRFAPVVRGDYAYFIQSGEIVQYDLQLLKRKTRYFGGSGFHPHSLIDVDSKMVMIGRENSQFLYELDDFYF